MPNKVKKQAVLIIDNIRSQHNVGSIFRTADCVGVSHIYLCGTTPTPLDKYGRPVSEIAKTALGAEKSMPYTYAKSTVGIINRLRKEGFEIIAIEQSKNSVDYRKLRMGSKVAFIVGNEVLGVSDKVLKLCDYVAEIPLRGEKESLNVAVATGIALFRMIS